MDKSVGVALLITETIISKMQGFISDKSDFSKYGHVVGINYVERDDVKYVIQGLFINLGMLADLTLIKMISQREYIIIVYDSQSLCILEKVKTILDNLRDKKIVFVKTNSREESNKLSEISKIGYSSRPAFVMQNELTKVDELKSIFEILILRS